MRNRSSRTVRSNRPSAGQRSSQGPRQIIPGGNAREKILWLFTVALRVLIVLCLASLQTSLFTRFHLLGAVPDLVGPYVLALAYFKNDRIGMIAGLGGGFLVDALSGAGLSVLCLFYPLMALFLGNNPDEIRAGQSGDFSRFCLSAPVATGARLFLEVLLRAIGGGLSLSVLPMALLFFLCSLLFGIILRAEDRR